MNIRILIAPVVCALAGSANAAEPVIEEITVVGSRIIRADFTSASPVFTIDREDILRNGTPTLTEYLNRSPQFAPANDRTANNTGQGRGEANLRALGAKRTLVMLDGRRLGPAGSDGPVDLNLLPAGLVERVEVLTGGASAVYGSDAVSGVVNIRLRRDVEGIEVSAGYEVTADNDGDIQRISIHGGRAFADGRGGVSAFFDSTRRDSIATADREFSSQPLTDDFRGNLVPFGSPATPAGHIPAPATIDGMLSFGGITFDPDGSPRAYGPTDGYNFYAEFNYLQVDLDRDTLALFGHYDVSPRTRVTLDLIMSQRTIDTLGAPLPIAFGAVEINLDNPNLTPAAQAVLAANYDPMATGSFVGPFLYRANALGGRETDYERDDLRLAASVRHSLDNGWRLRGSLTWSENRSERSVANLASTSRYLQSLRADPATGACLDPSNGCVAGNYFGAGNLTPAAAAFIRAPDLQTDNYMEQLTLQWLADGDVELAGRQVSLAVGLEWRRDEAGSIPDSSIDTADIILAGLPVLGDKGEITTREVFAEVVVPVIDTLLLEAGLRWSDHNTIGKVLTWKAGLTLEAPAGLVLRAMAQRAVRAPNVVEQFREVRVAEDQGAGFALGSDPCSASNDPVGAGIADVCIAQGLAPALLGVFEANRFFPAFIKSGGNRALEEERADTLTVGFTWQPEIVDGLSLAVDYYAIEIDNAITELNRGAVENQCYTSRDPDNPFCSNIERGPTGHVDLVTALPANIAQLTSKGIDLHLEYRHSVGNLGTLRVHLLGNHSLENNLRLDPTQPALDCTGRFGIPCGFAADGSIPENRVNLSLDWEHEAVSAQLAWRWIDRMRNGVLLIDDPFLATASFAVEETNTRDYFDLNLAWRPVAGLGLRAGVANLLDRQPPLLGFNAQQANTNPNLYDVLGRRFHVQASYRF